MVGWLVAGSVVQLAFFFVPHPKREIGSDQQKCGGLFVAVLCVWSVCNINEDVPKAWKGGDKVELIRGIKRVL